MYSKTTNGVTVTVTPYFLDDQSSPQDSHFVWAYQVNITNAGNCTIKLDHRNWLIIDANGKVITTGDYPNISRHIRVEVHESVRNAVYSDQLVPFGHEAYISPFKLSNQKE